MDKKLGPKAKIAICVVVLVLLYTANFASISVFNFKGSSDTLEGIPIEFWGMYLLNAAVVSVTTFILRRNLKNKVARGIVTYMMVCAMLGLVMAVVLIMYLLLFT